MQHKLDLLSYYQLVFKFLSSIVKLLIFSAFFVVIIGCATAYQSVGYTGGFSEQWISQNAVLVKFQANSYTSTDRAQAFGRLRATELAIENGFNYIHFTRSINAGIIVNYRTPAYISGNIIYGGLNIPVFAPSIGVYAIFTKSQDEYPNVKGIRTEVLLESIKKEYGLSEPRLEDIQNRVQSGSGKFVEGKITSENISGDFSIEMGNRTGSIRIPINGNIYKGNWLLIIRGDSVVEIGGEIKDESGMKGFVKLDVISGDTPTGYGTFALEDGKIYKLSF